MDEVEDYTSGIGDEWITVWTATGRRLVVTARSGQRLRVTSGYALQLHRTFLCVPEFSFYQNASVKAGNEL